LPSADGFGKGKPMMQLRILILHFLAISVGPVAAQEKAVVGLIPIFGP
jgi:hypothetical protein